MRKIRCIEFHRENVESFLEELNDRRGEFGITNESDIISISTRPDTRPHNLGKPDGTLVKSEIVISVFFWDNDETIR